MFRDVPGADGGTKVKKGSTIMETGKCHPQGCMYCPDMVTGCDKELFTKSDPKVDNFVVFPYEGIEQSTGKTVVLEVVSWDCKCGKRHDFAYSVKISGELVEALIRRAPEVFCRESSKCLECGNVFYRASLLANIIFATIRIEASALAANSSYTTIAGELKNGTICKDCAIKKMREIKEERT
jgi:hypothetical protein